MRTVHVLEEFSVTPKDGMKQFPQKKRLRREASLSKSKAKARLLFGPKAGSQMQVLTTSQVYHRSGEDLGS